MNLFLASLNESQEDWEGDCFTERIGNLLNYSRHHFRVYDPNNADAILFLESNRFKSQHDLSCFRRTELLQEFAHKSYTLNYSDSPIAFLPGLYVCLPRQLSDPCWTRAIPYPWQSPNKELATFRHQPKTPEHLLSFRGNISHPIRQNLLDVMVLYRELGPANQTQRWYDHTADEFLDYLQEIVDSHFVLCPRGIGTSTYRLFEVLSLGRVPIIISDDWVPPEGVDWNSCSIRVAEERLFDIPEVVDHYIDRWHEMSAAATTIWRKCFQDSVLADFLFDQLESLLFHRHPFSDWSYLDHRAKSSSFRRQNQWDYKSKARRLLLNFRRFIKN